MHNVVSQQEEASGLEQLISALKDRDPDHPQAFRWRYLNALGALENCRVITASVAPALREFIAGEPDPELQKRAAASLASITSAEVVQAPTSNQASGQDLAQEVNSGSRSVADLANALQDPKARVQAARALDILGPKASEALPALHKALQSDDVIFQELVALVIKRIDPTSPKPLFTSDELTPAMHAVSDQLASADSAIRDSLQQEINQELKKHSLDSAQISAFADKLGAVDPKLRDTFVAKLLEFDPALKTKLIPGR
jgi:hypothetical protein